MTVESRTKLFTTLTATLAVTAFVMVFSQTRSGFLGDHAVLVATFAGLLVFLELRPLPSLSEPVDLSFSWAFAYTLLFLAPPVTAMVIASLTMVAAGIKTKRALVRTVFNASQFPLALAFGILAGSAIGDPLQVARGGGVNLEWVATVLVTCTVGFIASSVLVGAVLGIHQERSLVQTIKETLVENAEADGPLLAWSPTFVLVGVQGELLLPLLLISAWIIVETSRRSLTSEQAAGHDELTGLPNRRTIKSSAQMLLDNAIASGTPMAVVQVDLDGFKEVNDQLGHKFGDGVLREVAGRLRANTRAADHVARLGGDEFVLVLASSNTEGARRVAAECLKAIEEPIWVEDAEISISASLGVSSFPEDGKELGKLLHHADLAMYVAKQSRMGIAVFAESIGGDQRDGTSILSGSDKLGESGDGRVSKERRTV